MRPSAVPYYLSSIPVLLGGVRRPFPAIASLAFAGRRADTSVEIALKDGTRFAVRSLMDLWIIKETCLDRDYERIGPRIEDGWTVLDIGAGMGDFCVHVARRFPRARVIGYEPFAQSFKLLQHNIALNGVANLRAYPLAVSSDGRPMQLSMIGAAVQHSTSAAGAPASGSMQAVQSVTLAGALDREGIAQCDLLKIDCEGGEFDILLNASDALLRRFRNICLEYHDALTTHRHGELAERFKAAGFEVSVHPNPVHADIGLMHAARK